MDKLINFKIEDFITKSFKLNGLTWDIVMSDTLIKDKGCYGLCVYEQCKIFISTEINGSLQQNVLLHEIVHAILLSMEETKLSDNEKLVQGIANGLHQIINSI